MSKIGYVLLVLWLLGVAMLDSEGTAYVVAVSLTCIATFGGLILVLKERRR